ncbi:hypothetical protein HMPREF9104_02604 [Lentilactobacillus kisonensis F0435]|uniref:Uncharacterized protein n=1 Tax=Lentilactobacillus kisonensis F0435 TaxID=797516 RepID=H1LJ12_9LACO|nr:hypothetical protein HMPREF9104_02604 [Lentilactobacillus kisonensis F0435]
MKQPLLHNKTAATFNSEYHFQVGVAVLLTKIGLFFVFNN